jgi:23S rRNA (uridine2552-2'-O)-methyltransferase
VARYERKDHFHQKAKSEGTRSRAYYKLDEMQKAHRVLAKGQKVADLGCWPGGWMQYAAKVVGGSGRVVGVDLAELETPFSEPNVEAFVGDLEDAATAARLVDALGAQADVVLSDAAPKLTGVRERDRAMEERLLDSIEAMLPALLRPGGGLLIKILDGPEAQAAVKRLSKRFDAAKTVKCKSTRKGSTEKYLWAKGFEGAA